MKKKKLNQSFLTSLNDGAHYADKNEPKQPQVCKKNFGITTNSSFQVFVKSIKALGGLGNPQLSTLFKNILHMVFLQ